MSVRLGVDQDSYLASGQFWGDRLLMVSPPNLAEQVDKVAQRLAEEFSATVPDQVVRSLVTEVYGEMSTAKVTQFVPVLIDRKVRAELRHLRVG